MKVLIAMDDSSHASKALKWYVTNVHREGNEVVLYSYVDAPYVPKTVLGGAPMMSRREVDEMLAEHAATCTRKKEKLAEMCKESGLTAQHVIVETKDGGAGRHIIQTAEEHGVNAIVTGTRGQGAISRTVFGSVSNYVLHHSHVPVFICRDA